MKDFFALPKDPTVWIGLILTIIAAILVFTVFRKDMEEFSRKKTK